MLLFRIPSKRRRSPSCGLQFASATASPAGVYPVKRNGKSLTLNLKLYYSLTTIYLTVVEFEMIPNLAKVSESTLVELHRSPELLPHLVGIDVPDSKETEDVELGLEQYPTTLL